MRKVSDTKVKAEQGVKAKKMSNDNKLKCCLLSFAFYFVEIYLKQLNPLEPVTQRL
jgi:hypothetical protein